MGIRQIDNALRRGMGFAGKVTGTQYSVYRLNGATGTPNAAPHIIHPLNLVLANFNARIVRDLPKVVQEQEDIYRLLYTGMCDTRALRVGDIFVQTGPTMTDVPDGRMFTLADVQPLLPPVFVRTEVAATLTRPQGDAPGNEPLYGKTGYQGESKFTEGVCTLEEGLYELPGAGIPTVIPMGLQPHRRLGSSQEFKYNTATHRGIYYGYCPLLPGIQIQPGDYVCDKDGNRLLVHICSAFEVGIQGWMLQMETVFT